jgi:hypothetical protein
MGSCDGTASYLERENQRLRRKSELDDAKIRELTSQCECEMGGFQHVIRKKDKAIAILAVIAVVEALVIPAVSMGNLGTILGENVASSTWSHVRALRDTKKLLRKMAKDTRDITQAATRRSAQTQTDGLCKKLASHITSEVLQKIEEKLEDKVAELVKDQSEAVRPECQTSEATVGDNRY